MKLSSVSRTAHPPLKTFVKPKAYLGSHWVIKSIVEIKAVTNLNRAKHNWSQD